MIPFPIQCQLSVPEKELDFEADHTEMVIWPLTYDGDSSTGAYAFGAQIEPWITPAGLQGDADRTGGIPTTFTPAWWTPAGVSRSLHARIKAFGPKYQIAEKAVSVGETDSFYIFLISNETDVAGSPTAGQLALSTKETSGSAAKYIYLNRHTWHFERRIPRLTSGAYTARPQSLTWLDADTLIVSAHYEDQESRFFRIRASDLECTGECSSTTYKHVGSSALDADGVLWATDGTYTTFALDLPHCWGSARVQTAATWDTTALFANVGLTFATIGGTNYVLLQQYSVSGTAYLYVYLTSQMGTPAVVAERVKRFNLGQSIQDIHYASGKLWVSRNRETADATATGKIQRYDIATAITSTPDGSTLMAEATWDAPCAYPEGIDFHPSTGHLWCASDGLTSVGSSPGWLSIWSSPLDGQGVENSYMVDYDATDDSVVVRVNGRLFDEATWSPASSGGGPRLLGGVSHSFVGTINNVAIANGPFSRTEYERLQSGYYEPYTLSSVTVPLVNPGGEAGSTAGWTTETGTPLVATTNPAPHSGSYYLQGGGGVNFRYSQRADIATLTGLSTAQIDALGADLWCRADCWRASYDATSDPGAIGVRTLNATPAEQGISYDNLESITPQLTWLRRASARAAATGTRYFDVVLRGDRTSGTNVDSKFDDVTATIYWRAT